MERDRCSDVLHIQRNRDNFSEAAFWNSLAVAVIAMAMELALSSINTATGVFTVLANEIINKKSRVTFTAEINNWTNLVLDNPEARISEGKVEIPPSPILPGQSGVMVARKTAYTATGTYGTVSWLLKGEDRRVVVMWVAPFNFDFYDNWLAVGMTSRYKTDHAETWYKQMYYQESDKVLEFSKQNYKDNIIPVTYEDAGIEILGTMSTTHHAQAKITIRPLDSSKYAKNIKDCFS